MPETVIVPTTSKSKFGELLASIGDGTLEQDLSDIVVGLAEDLRQMGEHGSGKPAGQITIKIKMKYDRGIFEVDPQVDVRKPQVVRPRTLMYPAKGGGLSRNNPQQIEAFKEPPINEERPMRSLALNQ